MTNKYFHKRMAVILTVAATALFCQVPAGGDGGQAEPVDKIVQHLIAYVARSDLTFVRNSRQYTAKEAAEHMQKKYEYYRDDIETPEGFIEMCATRSILSGEPYMIINKQGEKIRTSEWLLDELQEYRNSAMGKSD
jgi:hypothetical protein